jgi:hypothetical protein
MRTKWALKSSRLQDVIQNHQEALNAETPKINFSLLSNPRKSSLTESIEGRLVSSEEQ